MTSENKLTQELKDFESKNGVVLSIGLSVRFSPESGFDKICQGSYIISGIKWNDYSRSIEVDIRRNLDNQIISCWPPDYFLITDK